MSLGTTALVTGGAGFLGSHLCDRLLAEGRSVVCLDNLVSGRVENISHLLTKERFEFVDRDVTKPFRFDVDEIYNLACPASPVQYQSDPVETTRTIVLGALQVLETARVTGAPIFQASTSEVYGDPEIHPQPESYVGRVNPVSARACYSEAKRCAETLFFDYYRQHGVVVKVARIFNTYGPRMRPDDGRVVSNFAMQALLGEPVTIHGDGSQTRSFCYVDDLIEAIVRFMKTDADFTGPLNLGNPVEHPILAVAAAIADLTGSKTSQVFEDRPQDDPARRCPDIGLANRTLDWSPTVGLEEGLRPTVAYFRALISDARAGATAEW